jgi:hypothetical protein
MKKFLSVLAFAAVFATPVFAAEGTATDIKTTNTRAASKFNADYAGANGIWSSEQRYDEVLFFWHNNLMDAYYDKDGNLIGAFHEVEATQLPGNAAVKIASDYKGYTIKTTTVMEKDGEDPTYYVKVQSPSHLLILEVDNTGSIREFKTVR